MVTPARTPILIVGTGGHARVLAALIARLPQYAVIGALDRSSHRRDETIGQNSVVGTWTDLPSFATADAAIALAIGNNTERAEMFARVKTLGFAVPVLQHPLAIVDVTASVGEGAVLCVGCIVGAEAVIGRNVIVNSGAIVDHECRIDDHAHVAPGCRIAGRVRVGERTFVGIGTSVRDQVRIGRDVTIGAGAVVVSDIPDSAMAYGVPARVQSREGVPSR